jgi:hypothetical protein
MDFLKKTLSFVILTGLLTGCQLTEEEKEKIEQAGENLEKIASAPFIAYPAENDTVNNSGEIRLIIDDSVDYKSMALIVDGIEVAVDYEAPYGFQWDPYYWSNNAKATFIIRAITAGENLLRSEVRTVEIGSNVHNLVKVTNPSDGQILQNVNSTDISWNARTGAESYDVQINGVMFNTDQTTASIDLPTIGNYSMSVRAIDSQGHKGKWSDESRISLAILSAPEVTSPSDGQVLQNVNSTDISWIARDGAASYDIKINGVMFNTDQTTASIDLPAIGDYSMSVRAIDSQGHEGQWSDERRISLAIPSAPSIYISDPVDSENDWQVSFNWTGVLGASYKLQIATDADFTSRLEEEDLATTSYSASLVAGIYYARVRTTNEFGYISQWSEVSSVEVGMFSAKIDMHTYGAWSNEDAPVDFVIEDEGVVIAAMRSNERDGSGDDFYVSKVNLQGVVSWGKSYKPQINNPKSIAKMSNGYVLPGNGASWGDGKVIAIDSLGNQSWQKNVTSSANTDGDFGGFSKNRIEAIAEVSAGKFMVINRKWNCIYSSENHNSYSCSTHTDELILIERDSEVSNTSSNQIVQPASGKYDYFSQLLLTDSGLYAAGRYTAANDSSQDSSADGFTPSTSASGAVLLKLSKTDGSIISTRTAGGIKYSTLTSIAETKSGDIVVGYNNYYAAVTSSFKPDGSSDSKIDGSQKNAQVVADPHGKGYITLAQHRNVDDYYLTRYNEANVRVGESKRLSQCFNELRAKKIKSHPKHGVVILGTDNLGSSYGDTHTVYFNVTEDFKYLCPE